MSPASSPFVRLHRLRPPLLGAEDVDRPRLTAAIRATVPAGTCVVSAPPGYGATTAVAQALHHEPGLAWVALDDLDTTPAHFWGQLTAALASEAKADLPDLPEDGEVLGLMSALVDWIDGSSCEWIVLDGVDSVAHAAWLPALAYLVANLPRRTRLVLTTHDALRRMPVDPADRRLTVIDGDLLLADPEEAAGIALAAHADVTIDSLEEITTASQGWVAAIRAAARYASQHPGGHAGHWLGTQGAHDLLEPWLRRLPDDRLAFLESTVFLDRLCGPLCDSVLTTSGSLRMLETLESHGSYLIATAPGVEGLRWWSRHPLLTAALRLRTADIDDTDRDLRAAAWFDDNGDLPATMRHLLAAGRLDEAGQLLRTHENALFEKGQADRVSEWYASLPPDSWGQYGWHLVRVAWGQALSSSPQSADITIAQLRAHLAHAPIDESDQRVLRAETATLTAYLAALAGDTKTTIASAGNALDLFSDENGENSQQIAPILLIRALLWEGNVGRARRELGHIRYEQFPSGLLRDVGMKALQAQCLTDEGHVTQARRDVARGKSWLEHHGLDPVGISQFSLITADGSSTLESGEILSGARLIETSAEAALAKGAVGDAAVALIWLSRARIAQGQLGDSLLCVQRARRLLTESAPTSEILHRIDLAEAFIRHLGGDSVRAERLIQRVPSGNARTLLWARVTMHRQASSVRRSLATVDTDTPRIAVEKQLLLAMVAMKRSSTLAEGYLVKAADVAAANGLHLALLGYPPDVLDLARSVASRSSHDGLAHLLACLRDGSGSDVALVEQDLPSGVNPGPPLSAGELELITFLPRRDSNADIARQLGVSVNTVKTRLYRMYRKLGVDSRDEAIRVARARGILV